MSEEDSQIGTKEKTFYNVKNIVEFIKIHNSFALFCHIDPDGDALGSLVAMKLALYSLKKEVKIYCDGQVPDDLKFLNINLDTDLDFISMAEVVMMLDANTPSRIGKYAPYFEHAHLKAKIDHHMPSNYIFDCDATFSDSPSTCDIVIDVLRALGVKIDDKIAPYLYAGISSDTGCFLHPSVNSRSHYNAFELMNTGFDFVTANFFLFKYKRDDFMPFLKTLLRNAKTYLNGDIIIAFMNFQNYKKFEKTCDMCPFDFLDGIDKNKISVRIFEKEKGKYFVSLRSQSKYNVCNIAKSFGGGGHVRASGFDMKASKSALLKALLSACRKEIDSIDKTN